MEVLVAKSIGATAATTSAPRFRKVGGRYVLDGENWVGSVIASTDALYILKRFRPGGVSSAGIGVVAGAIGGAILGALTSGEDKARPQPHTCTYGELPLEIREHPEWPVPPRLRRMHTNAKTSVVIIPKASIEQIRNLSWSNLMSVKNPMVRLVIDYIPFTGGTKRKHLRAMGYPVK
jgi:hypothetical protein